VLQNPIGNFGQNIRIVKADNFCYHKLKCANKISLFLGHFTDEQLLRELCEVGEDGEHYHNWNAVG
jgi:hypothetical protein